ncbi:glycoside hydrolase family 37 protein [Polychaeton citri CBS 116435]|uniref:Trehalase n=1 Tax=Polychaeton citri CBS 116435 TaxID=1314669 RepID=A0A9P4QAK0_9PEZI|nr:glycoside hydrolase family 37 protein [Polychaeton citri CBS 116435]
MTFKCLRLLVVASPAVALYVNGSITAPCDSPIYCQGRLLRAIELARPFVDSKTFVDLPTVRPLDEVLEAFERLATPISNNTELNDFLTIYFGEAGSELYQPDTGDLTTNATFLENVADGNVSSFIEQVISIWPDLTRRYNESAICDECVSSFIPVNRTFVVAGGRFREPYYWDSFWIVEGLLRTQGSFTEIALNIIENFLDLVEEIGFVPNGARLYYLNRSQPPLLTQMVKVYVDYVDDTSILERALPLLEKEHEFFMNNRSIEVAMNNQTYTLNHYEVSNNQPRPESYREDYITANNQSYYAESGIIYPASELNDTEKAILYSNLASGAESGWDYTSRWLFNPSDAVEDKYFPLRSLNTAQIVPVDLNSILYANEMTISAFHRIVGNDSAADEWAELAAQRSKAMLALMWDEDYFRYFDFNMTSMSRNVLTLADDDTLDSEVAEAPEYQISFSSAQYYPFWTGAAPEWLKNNPLAIQRVYEPVAALLKGFPGAIPATNLLSGQQWDEPNVWPPLQYIIIKGLLNTPATFGSSDPTYDWTQQLALNLTQRYLDSAFCTWRVTGGSTPDIPQLPDENEGAIGIIFEKYNSSDVNAAGGGGEYEVVEGFGWSNGVLIWAADVFGQNLTTPDCGNISAADVNPTKRSAVHLDRRDLRKMKAPHRRN